MSSLNDAIKGYLSGEAIDGIYDDKEVSVRRSRNGFVIYLKCPVNISGRIRVVNQKVNNHLLLKRILSANGYENIISNEENDAFVGFSKGVETSHIRKLYGMLPFNVDFMMAIHKNGISYRSKSRRPSHSRITKAIKILEEISKI